MKNILIPTDYTVQSLELVCKTAEIVDEPLNICLFHAFELPDGISDLLFMKERMYNAFITETLRQRCKQIKAQYSNIRNISFKRLYGNTAAVFSTFAEANNIHMIALPDDYVFIAPSRESVDPVNMFKKSGLPIVAHFVYDKSEPVIRFAMST